MEHGVLNVDVVLCCPYSNFVQLHLLTLWQPCNFFRFQPHHLEQHFCTATTDFVHAVNNCEQVFENRQFTTWFDCLLYTENEQVQHI